MLCMGMDTQTDIGFSSNMGEATFQITMGKDPKSDLKIKPDL